MARRESQGLQITLIVFVILTIMLLVTTIVFWNRAKTLTADNESLQTANAEAQAAATTALDGLGKLKVWLGHTAQTSVEDIEAQYNRDMATYAKSAPEVQRTYKDVPVLLFSAIQARNKTILDLREQLRLAQEGFDKTKSELEAAAGDARKVQAAKEAELLALRQEFDTYRNQLNQQKDEQAAAVDKTRKDLADLQAKADKQLQEAQRNLKNTQQVLTQRDTQIKELTETTFEVPDGKVTWVNPRSNLVYINLGSADGLRNQVTFAVYGTDVNNLAKEEKKGTVEVTRVVNEHLSEARIVAETGKEPIVPGDVVYTPLWSANSAMRFALAGAMDINDDGKDDRDVVRRLITMNHGKIDAEDKDGDVSGSVTRNTRYIVMGGAPEVGDKSDASAASRQAAWSKIVNEARANGVEEISVQQLLDYIGYDGEKRVVPLGTEARAESRNSASNRNSSAVNMLPDAGARE